MCFLVKHSIHPHGPCVPVHSVPGMGTSVLCLGRGEGLQGGLVEVALVGSPGRKDAPAPGVRQRLGGQVQQTDMACPKLGGLFLWALQA